MPDLRCFTTQYDAVDCAKQIDWIKIKPIDFYCLQRPPESKIAARPIFQASGRGKTESASKKLACTANHFTSSKAFMKIIRSAEFKAECPWGAINIANMNGVTNDTLMTVRKFLRCSMALWKCFTKKMARKNLQSSMQGIFSLHPLALSTLRTQLGRPEFWL